MTKSAYETHLEARRRYAEDNAELINQVLGAGNGFTGTQHILWMKTVFNKLDDGDKNKTFTSSDGMFGFTECLVNRLMHFAYLKGIAEINERSYRQGWEAARREAVEALANLG